MAISAQVESPRMPSPISVADWSLLLLLGTIWGGSFFFARIAVQEIPPVTLVFLRVAIAALVLNCWLAAQRRSIAAALPMAGKFVVLALLNNIIPYALIFAGQTSLGAGLASVLNATTPFWTMLFANALTADEKISKRKFGGILIGMAGIAILVGPGALAGIGSSPWAKFAVIGAAMSYALAAIFAKRFAGLPAPLVAAGQLSASTFLVIPLMLAVDGAAGFAGAGTAAWLSVLALAAICTAFAYVLYFRLVASAGATNAALVTLIVPASAVMLGSIFLAEKLQSFEIAGMVLIGAGLITIDGRAIGLIGRKICSAGKIPATFSPKSVRPPRQARRISTQSKHG